MSVHLDCRTAITTVERAMLDAISLCYQNRLPDVATLLDLAALPSAQAPDRVLRFVTSEGLCYRFHRYSSNDHAPPYVVRPDDLPADKPGRWERTSSNVTKGPAYFRPVNRVRTGYARQVELWQGLSGKALERIYGSTPAFQVRLADVDIGSRTTAGPYGALYSLDFHFEIYCWSKNYRQQNQALWGSTLADESTDTSDPGLNRMMGDLWYLFGGGTGIGLGPGVAQARINGTHSIVDEDHDNREFCGVVPILVQASFNIPDEDLVPIESVEVQFQDAHIAKPGRSFDRDNYVASGYRVTYGPGTGLVLQIGPGVAYVDGQLVASTPGARAVEADQDIYRFLSPDGSMSIRSVPNDYEAPSGPLGSLLIGKSVTDSSDVIFDSLLCDWLQNSGQPFDVAQT